MYLTLVLLFYLICQCLEFGFKITEKIILIMWKQSVENYANFMRWQLLFIFWFFDCFFVFFGEGLIYDFNIICAKIYIKTPKKKNCNLFCALIVSAAYSNVQPILFKL